MSSTAEDLPQELWSQILQHVPWQHRLSQCALVCRKLARAAAAATQSLRLSFGDFEDTPSQLDALLAWTNSYGSSLTSLIVGSSPDHTPIRQLPCRNLIELQLYEGRVQLGASSEHMGLLRSCPELAHLCLILEKPGDLLDSSSGWRTTVVPPGAVPSAAVPQLKRFDLVVYEHGFHQDAEALHRLGQAVGQSLGAHIAFLEHLLLEYPPDERISFPKGSCFLQPISSMVGLKEGVLRGAGPVTAATLPGIEHLTALQDLELEGCELEPSCLLPMTTGLTRLKLLEVTLQPLEGQHSGASQLLQLLARLTALRSLTLNSVVGEWPQQLAQFSGLTASSNLQELNIDDCGISGTVWPHAFPAGRKLPQLRSLKATKGLNGRCPAPFGSADIGSLVSCCPAVEELDFTPAADASLAPLLTLTQLRSLRIIVSMPADSDGEDASRGLQHLVPLTALTGLTSFSSQGHGHYVSVSSEAPAGSAPDVWVQLLETCAADQAAQPAVISSVVRQLQQQQEQVAQLLQHTQGAAAGAEAGQGRDC